MARRRLALAGIVALAVAVRLAGIGDRLSADEGYSWLVASAPDADAFLDRLAAYENTPPLFYLLLSALPLDDEAWLRLPSLLASVAAVPVLYAIVRPLLGTPAALLAALLLAVAPYHVSFSNYSRAFMLAGLGLLLALWAASRLAQGGRRRWWCLYAAGAVVAIYSEYDAGLFLVALVGVLLALGTPPRRETLLFGTLPALAIVPWLGQLERSLDRLDVTKVSPIYPEPSLTALRDVAVPLAFGEHGAAESAGGRWLQFLLVAGLVAAAAVVVRRHDRRASALLAGTGLGVIVLSGIVALAGPDVFAQRYLTVLIPLGAALAGGFVALLPWRRAVPVAAAGLCLLGVAVFATRHGRELEPDPEPVVAAVERVQPDLVVTNSAVVAYHLRDFRVALDRPFGLERPAVPCGPECLVVAVDDTRVAGGARDVRGGTLHVGPITVTLVTPAAEGFPLALPG
ncbi:MAG: glycosyltransferase family 39 protein [Thermoleophilaceae bacterium]